MNAVSKTRFRTAFSIVLMLALALLSLIITGCPGKDGATGATGPVGPAGPAAASGSITGTVVDFQGNPKASITVVAVQVAPEIYNTTTQSLAINQVQHTAITTAIAKGTRGTGNFTIKNLVPGYYVVVALANGNAYDSKAGFGLAHVTAADAATSTADAITQMVENPYAYSLVVPATLNVSGVPDPSDLINPTYGYILDTTDNKMTWDFTIPALSSGVNLAVYTTVSATDLKACSVFVYVNGNQIVMPSPPIPNPPDGSIYAYNLNAVPVYTSTNYTGTSLDVVFTGDRNPSVPGVPFQYVMVEKPATSAILSMGPMIAATAQNFDYNALYTELTGNAVPHS